MLSALDKVTNVSRRFEEFKVMRILDLTGINVAAENLTEMDYRSVVKNRLRSIADREA